jgi:hypothetical protein
MAKWGRFECGSTEPIETYEGDFMRSESSYVRIFRGGDWFGKDDFAELLATIRLSKGQSVREIIPAQEVAALPKKSRQKATC